MPERPDAELFRNIFRDLKPRYSTGFFDVFYRFMESGSSRWSTSTYRKVKTIYKHLREFEEYAAYKLTFRNLDDKFLEKFRAFYAEKGNGPSTTRKAVNILVWFLNWASGEGFHVDRSYRMFYGQLGEFETAGSQDSRLGLFLQWDELVRLSEFRGESRKTEWVRDLFCFMCFTGLNYNELQLLRKEDIGPDEIRIRKPTGRIRRVPMSEQARKIHRAYESRYYLNNTAFPTMSIITLNKYLRMLGREAGLDRMVVSGDDSGDKVPLAERLTAGIAVHTFIANALELNVPPEVIASFTGVQKDSRVRRIKMELAREAAGSMRQESFNVS
jgi:integrase